MSTNFCPHCSYTTLKRYNLDRHIEKQHKTAQNHSKTAQNHSHVAQNHSRSNRTSEHVCDECKKQFKNNYRLQRHIPICKGVSNPLQCPTCKEIFNSQPSKSRHVTAKTCVAPIQPMENTNEQLFVHSSHNANNLNHSNNTTTINNNITINNYGHENTDYITDELLLKCLEAQASGVKVILESMWFNDEHPENHNVKLYSLKQALVHVVKDNEWNVQSLTEVCNDMVRRATIKITSGVANKLEPTDAIIRNMNAINSLKAQPLARLRQTAKANLVSRRNRSN